MRSEIPFFCCRAEVSERFPSSLVIVGHLRTRMFASMTSRISWSRRYTTHCLPTNTVSTSSSHASDAAQGLRSSLHPRAVLRLAHALSPRSSPPLSTVALRNVRRAKRRWTCKRPPPPLSTVALRNGRLTRSRDASEWFRPCFHLSEPHPLRFSFHVFRGPPSVFVSSAIYRARYPSSSVSVRVPP